MPIVPNVKLLYNSPLSLAVVAARKCTASKGDGMGEKDLGLLKSILNRGHTSVLEHISYTFEIPKLSRACLQEMSRHRISSPSVQSTRYTLSKLMDTEDLSSLLYKTIDEDINKIALESLIKLQSLMRTRGIKNDVAKYALPEAFITTMVWTINARSLSNFLSLRLKPGALKEIRELAISILDSIPKDHMILYEGI